MNSSSSDEDIDTGITEVDAIEVNYANAISVNVAEGGSGDFVAEEIVTGGNSNVTATVKSWNSATRQLVCIIGLVSLVYLRHLLVIHLVLHGQVLHIIH